jgi:hypothetical protein
MTMEGGLLASMGGAHWHLGAPYSPALGSLMATVCILSTDETSPGVSIQHGVSGLLPFDVGSALFADGGDAVWVGSTSFTGPAATSMSFLQPHEERISPTRSVAAVH